MFKVCLCVVPLLYWGMVVAHAQVVATELESGLESGKDLFDQHCEYCHGLGQGKGATDILGRRYEGAKLGSLINRTDLTPETIRSYVRNQTPGMPRFRPSELSDADLEQLIDWLTRNSQ